MTVKEKIEQEVNNENAIYLLKEGIFCRAYNQSAMRFVNNLKPLKINRKYRPGYILLWVSRNCFG
jgi:hypothetical protein